jgi:hypothetical protein
VPRGDVTLLAEPRLVDPKHVSLAGAVWVVTREAILGDRRMLPEEGPTLVGMAGETVLVDGELVDL